MEGRSVEEGGRGGSRGGGGAEEKGKGEGNHLKVGSPAQAPSHYSYPPLHVTSRLGTRGQFKGFRVRQHLLGAGRSYLQ